MDIYLHIDEQEFYQNILKIYEDINELLENRGYVLFVDERKLERVVLGLYKYNESDDEIISLIDTIEAPLFNLQLDIPQFEQLQKHVNKVEEVLNKMFKKYDIECHIDIIHYTLNDIDFFKRELHENSKYVSRSMSEARLDMENRLKSVDEKSEKIERNIHAFNIYKDCVKDIDTSNAYCFEIDNRVIRDYLRNHGFNNFVNNLNKREFISYYIGEEKMNKAVIIIENKTVYLVYNPSDRVQTFLFTDDLASTAIVEYMFGDNGQMVKW